MLKRLHVENFAVIDQVDVEFGPGLNIITGETGAGKSILIDALGSAIGGKIEADSLRKGATKTVAECIFQISGMTELNQVLQTHDIDQFDDTIILRKEISDNLRNRAFVNDTPVPNAILIDIGNLLVDLHGQHEHQSLLNTHYHIQYLDEFGNYQALLAQVRQHYHRLIELIDQFNALKQQQSILQEKRDLYEFQRDEISAINPKPGEEDSLLQEEKILQNSEKLYQTSTELFADLYDSEGSVFERIAAAQSRLDQLSAIDRRFETIKPDAQAARVAIEEIAHFLQRYFNTIEFNPERLEQIRTRLGQFAMLKRKYHRTMDELIAYREQIEQELQQIENMDDLISAKHQEIELERAELLRLSLELSEHRREAGQRLEREVLNRLAELGMKNAQFSVQILWSPDEKGIATIDQTKYRVTDRGLDHVEFYISTNPGEDLKPLVKVASGGEISRIMLALKSALAQVDRIPVLIFDEIDIGISGRIAQAVGLALKRLSKTHQIICITHLPQIASMGDQHFVVEKIMDLDSTRTRIRKLANEDRAVEIAKLLGGQSVSETHIQAARELIEEAEQFDKQLASVNHQN